MALKDRIQELLDAGFKKGELAKAAGKTSAAVTHWLNGSTSDIKSDSAAGLQALTGYSSVWLSTGKGPKKIAVGNVTTARPRKKVPLISWVKAGSWGEVEDFFNVGEADVWEEAFDSNPSDNAFALRVEGDSMTSPNPNELTFPEGTIIIVDPQRAASAGDFVVAKDVATQMATFKKLTYDAGRWFLRPLNPIYQAYEIDDPAIRVIGRVVEYRRGGKL